MMRVDKSVVLACVVKIQSSMVLLLGHELLNSMDGGLLAQASLVMAPLVDVEFTPH